MSKHYHSIEEMVRDLSDPEFADEFAETVRRKPWRTRLWLKWLAFVAWVQR